MSISCCPPFSMTTPTSPPWSTMVHCTTITTETGRTDRWTAVRWVKKLLTSSAVRYFFLCTVGQVQKFKPRYICNHHIRWQNTVCKYPLSLSLSLSLHLPNIKPSSIKPSSPCQVMTNINGNQDWKTCFTVGEVDLPTGYYFGFSATTGDLAGKFPPLPVPPLLPPPPLHAPLQSLCLTSSRSFSPTDNHDIITVRVYDIDEEDNDNKAEEVTIYLPQPSLSVHVDEISLSPPTGWLVNSDATC